MADGATIDYSSPSGSTIEFNDLASIRSSSRLSSRISFTRSNPSWHPKLTPYRLLVILSTVGLAVAKTATSYLNLTFASITLEWILGVAVFLFFHLLDAYEETSNRYFTWLFNFDCMEYPWVFLEKLTGFSRPCYISEEIDTRHQATGIHPPVTGYRIIVTLVVASVGMTKSALIYGQEAMDATTVECVFGVGIFTGLYWLGLYEASSIKVYPKLFHVDYSAGLFYVTETAIVFLYLFALLACSAASYGSYLCFASLFSPEMAANVSGTRTVHLIALAILFWGLLSFMFLGTTWGVFGLVYHLGHRYHTSPLGQFIASLPGVRLISHAHREYWSPSGLFPRPRPRFFYLKRFIIRQSVKMPLSLVLLYAMIVVFMYCVAILLLWYSMFTDLVKDGPWYWLLGFFSISLVIMPPIVELGVGLVRFVYRGVVDYFLEAWKDFTVEVESSNVLVESSIERV